MRVALIALAALQVLLVLMRLTSGRDVLFDPLNQRVLFWGSSFSVIVIIIVPLLWFPAAACGLRTHIDASLA